jgi:hypothetical protein
VSYQTFARFGGSNNLGQVRTLQKATVQDLGMDFSYGATFTAAHTTFGSILAWRQAFDKRQAATT